MTEAQILELRALTGFDEQKVKTALNECQELSFEDIKSFVKLYDKLPTLSQALMINSITFEGYRSYHEQLAMMNYLNRFFFFHF
jgi:hypothetical protein